MEHYFKLLEKSWQQFRANPVLLLPSIFQIVLGLALLVVVFFEALVFILMYGTGLLKNPAIMLSSSAGYMLLIFFIIIDIAFLLLLSVICRAMAFGMYKLVIAGKKATVDSMAHGSRMYFGRYLEFLILKSVLFVVPALAGALIILISSRLSPFLSIALTVIFIMLYLGYAILLSLGMFFAEPILVYKKGSAAEIVNQSISYTRSKLGHVFLSLLTLMILGVGVALFFLVISLPIEAIKWISGFLGGGVLLVLAFLLQLLLGLMRVFVNLVLKVVVDLFIFNAYKK